MDFLDNKRRVLIPSFKIERKTKALNRSLWGFVGLISMFTVGVGVICLHMMLCAILNIISTAISDNIILNILPAVLFGLMFGVGLLSFFLKLMKAYVIEDDRIIVGKIRNKGAVKGSDLAFDAAVLSYMADNIGDAGKVSAASAVGNLSGVISLIAHNMQDGFAEAFFDTELYKKKDYYNPHLIKENKYFYIFKCDNKKVKVPKILTGMERAGEGKKEASILKRVLVRSLLVFLVCLSISVVDLACGKSNNQGYVDRITASKEGISEDMYAIGYEEEIGGEMYSRFVKNVSSKRRSSAVFNFDKRGNLERVKFETYYNSFSDSIDEELNYLIKTASPEFTQGEIDEFIEAVKSTAKGEFIYKKLVAETSNIIIGTSEGHAMVHN